MAKFVGRMSLPTSVPISKKKMFSLNLNQYRNAHYMVLNKSKRVFEGMIEPEVRSLPKLNRILIIYKLYVKTKRKSDVSNVCTVVDKYFCDSLVTFGVLDDDYYEKVPTVIYSFGGIDPSNPRVDTLIFELDDLDTLEKICALL